MKPYVAACALLLLLTATGGVRTWCQAPLRGDLHPVHDPSMIRQAGTYYLFTTDGPRHAGDGYLPIRCSQDKITWSMCGTVFQKLPAWLGGSMPGLGSLWAPDISFFRGQYHLYYAASVFGTQHSVIALATNVTLDASSSAYRWVDCGPVLTSKPGDDFNAIDPNIFIDTDSSVWLTYGSFWKGIDQLQIQPDTGMVVQPLRHNRLAARPDTHAIEGPSLVRHEGFYYLFVSLDSCCTRNPAEASYKEAVGRASSPHGPFFDREGIAMTNGGATILLRGDAIWNAPGGGTAYVDDDSSESLIVFHALNMEEHGTPYLRIERLIWRDGWPTLP